jgi:hypothetical protein
MKATPKATPRKRLLAFGSAWMHPVARISCWDVKIFFSASYVYGKNKSGGKYKAAKGNDDDV